MRVKGRFTSLQNRTLSDQLRERVGEDSLPDLADDNVQPPAPGEVGMQAKRHTGTDTEFDA